MSASDRFKLGRVLRLLLPMLTIFEVQAEDRSECPTVVAGAVEAATKVIARRVVVPDPAVLLAAAPVGSRVRFRSSRSGTSYNARVVSSPKKDDPRIFAVLEDGSVIRIDPAYVAPESLTVAKPDPPPNYARDLTDSEGNLQHNLRTQLGGNSEKRSSLQGGAVKDLFENMLSGQTQADYRVLTQVPGEVAAIDAAFEQGAFLVRSLQSKFNRWEEHPIHGPYGAANEVLTKVELIGALRTSGDLEVVASRVPALRAGLNRLERSDRSAVAGQWATSRTIEQRYLLLRSCLMRGLTGD